MAAELLAWCTDDPAPTAGRLIHGPGGLGKTRLLIHVAAKLREQGWMAGFLDRPDELDEATLQAALAGAGAARSTTATTPACCSSSTMPRADRTSWSDLARRLAERPEADTRPIRLVLLARSAGEWWERLVDGAARARRLVRACRAAHPTSSPLPVIPRPEQRLRPVRRRRDCVRDRVLAAPGLRRTRRRAAAERLRRSARRRLSSARWRCRWRPCSGWPRPRRPRARQRHRQAARPHPRPGARALAEAARATERGPGARPRRGIGQVTLVQGVESRAPPNGC